MKLVTGSRGFIGQELIRALKANNVKVRGTVRQGALENEVAVGGVGPETDWRAALYDVDTVIHTAGLAHLPRGRDLRDSDLYAVNVEGTRRLAEQAVEVGVRRLVFISSVKALGDRTPDGHAFMSEDLPRPIDAYGRSKLKAEQDLFEIASRTQLEVVIVRAPLVYGPGVKANFLRMLHWLWRGFPLPFGSVNNRRSLLALPNLIDLLTVCIDHPAAANRAFFVSDGEDLSTSELLCRLGRYLGKPAKLVPLPLFILRSTAILAGRGYLVDRLLHSLRVDIRQTQALLGWAPAVSADAGLKEVADWYLRSMEGRQSSEKPVPGA